MNSKKRRHTCPLCGSVLSREKYEQVLNIDHARRMDIAHLNADLAKQRAAIREERRRIAAGEAAKASKNEEKLRSQINDLLAEVRQAKSALARKEQLSPHERKRIEKRAADEAAANLSMQLRRSDEARAKSEERRQRENDTWRRKIEELQRHVEAKERIHFGPEGEDELEKVLRRHFPADEIERRGRGRRCHSNHH